MANWVNLHSHTTFSMLDGHGTTENYAKRAKELQMGSLAITDHGNIHGWIDHYQACKDHDIKPILGLEAYQARKTRFDRDEEERAGPAKNEWEQRGPYHLSVIAQNKEGYNNLMKLSSRAFLEGYYVKPRLDLELLSEHSKGIILLSGCLGGAVQQALLRGDFDAALKHASTMQDIVGKENYFIEIQDHGLVEQKQVKEDTLKIAKLIGAKVVATGDCHYVLKEDHQAHDFMLCAGTKATIFDENRFKFEGPEFYLHSYEEMLTRFEPEWLQNTCDVADMVDVDIKFGDFHFPSFPDVPKDMTPDTLLEDQAWKGLKERYGDPLPDEVVIRAKHELGVVKRMGFQEYFLVVGDLVRWAKDNGIRVGFGRGSAAGSILSYALKITNLDPIRFGLIFERFLVEGRKTMPDIDLDFDDRYRERVIQYARDKYGEDHVAQICNFFTVGAKAAIKDAARVLGHDFTAGDKISKLVPPPVLGVSKTLEESLQAPELKRLYETDEEAREIIDAARGLEGVVRQTGVHAAGVIISPGPLTDYIPIMRRGDGQPLVSQWDMIKTEMVGMLKVDFLALRNLGVIDMAVDSIYKRHGVEVDVDNIDLDDQDVFDSIANGDTVGCFQIESSGMQDMVASVRPRSVEDIMAIISLYRPGPMGSGMDKMFVNRKHGRESVRYATPILEDVLDGSYGIMLYQEDVLNTTRAITGWNASEADDLRKVMGKKLMDKVGQYRAKFVADAESFSGIDRDVANKIYSDIEYFAGYGFNRAHAASYAMISYITAWLRHHYPAEYMAALLSSVANKKERLSLYLNQCRKMNLTVLPPDLNKSEYEFKVLDDETIIFGLSAIDGIGDQIIAPIIEARESYGEFRHIYDFFKACDNAVLNKSVFEHLLRSGALDNMVWFDPGFEVTRDEYVDMLESEKKETGLYITDHPIAGLWGYIKPNITHTVTELEGYLSSEPVKVGGIITKAIKRLTRQNKPMYILTLEDITGPIQIMVFPKAAEAIEFEKLQEGFIGVVTGRVMREERIEEEGTSSVVKIAMNSFDKIRDSVLALDAPIFLPVKTKLNPKQIERILDIIETNKGTSPVFLEVETEDGFVVSFKFNGLVSPATGDVLRTIINMNEVANG